MAAAPRTASSHTPDGEPGLNYLCAGYKAFFHHIDRPMRLMSKLLRGRRSAGRDHGALYAAEDANRGRNDPCPCGGGTEVEALPR